MVVYQLKTIMIRSDTDCQELKKQTKIKKADGVSDGGLSHRNICRIAAKWLKNNCREKCPVVLVELVTTAFETPDVFGCNSSHSILIEVKRSRSDFLRDKNKIFRLYPDMGVGDFRYYLCPAEVIKVEDLPEKWGLIWVDEKGRCRIIKEILTGNINSDNPNRFEKNLRNERAMMYSALRRKTSEK